jgi:hypothetical protein
MRAPEASAGLLCVHARRTPAGTTSLVLIAPRVGVQVVVAVAPMQQLRLVVVPDATGGGQPQQQ